MKNSIFNFLIKALLFSFFIKSNKHIYLYINKFYLNKIYPPYAAKNKLTKQQKELYKDYLNNIDDIYQIYIKQTINSNVLLGILILPINFLFSESNKIRKDFIQKYQIIYANLFEKQIFNDTTSAICVIYFRLRQQDNNKYIFSANLIKKTETKKIKLELSKRNDYSYALKM